MSSWVNVLSGVLQGSLLDPFLFVVYVNDIDQCLHSSKLLCFADDMIFFAAFASLDDMFALQADLCRLEEYCHSIVELINLTSTQLSVPLLPTPGGSGHYL